MTMQKYVSGVGLVDMMPKEIEEREAEIAAYEPPAIIHQIAKNAIWERATDDEAEAMDAMLQAQPVRLRRIYDGATHIATNHELYTMLDAALIEAFGEDRAAELLAP